VSITDVIRRIFHELVPLPAAEQRLNPAAIFDGYAQAIDAVANTAELTNAAKLLDLSTKLFETDGARRLSIDSRAASMMPAIALAATLVTGVGFSTLKDTSGLSIAAFCAMSFTLLITLVYLVLTVVLLFWIQGSIVRSTPDPIDVSHALTAAQNAYDRDVAVRLLRYTVSNYKVNNRATNSLQIAQKCLRNALLILVVGGIATVIIMFVRPVAPRGTALAQVLAVDAGCSSLPNLTVDQNGRWVGSCLRAGRVAKVVVYTDGRVEFAP